MKIDVQCQRFLGTNNEWFLLIWLINEISR